MIASILAIALLLQSQTVAVTPAPDQPAIIMSKVEAEVQFTRLCTETDISLAFDGGSLVITVKRSDAERLLIDPETPIDPVFVSIKQTPIRTPTSEEVRTTALTTLASRDRLLRALAAALNPMPNWAQMVMNGDASVCQRNMKPLIAVPVRASWEDPR